LLLMLGDARTHRAWPVPAEFRALTAVLWLQMALLLGYLLGSLWGGWSFAQGVSLLTFCFLLSYLLLALCFQCLLIRRLRDEAQAARAAQRRRESDLQRLVDNLDAGVMVFEPDQTLWRMNTAARRFLSWGGQEPHAPEASYNTWRMLDESGRPLGRH